MRKKGRRRIMGRGGAKAHHTRRNIMNIIPTHRKERKINIKLNKRKWK